MRKIGLFGIPLANGESFSWPDQQTLDSMPADIHVTKMVYKTLANTMLIAYVQFFYSNGS